MSSEDFDDLWDYFSDILEDIPPKVILVLLGVGVIGFLIYKFIF